jgi:serine/threonine protein kinase
MAFYIFFLSNYSDNMSCNFSGSSDNIDFSFGQPAKEPKLTSHVPEEGEIPYEDFKRNFRIDDKLRGKGMFGELYLAIHLPDCKQFAIKKVDSKRNPRIPSWGRTEIMREIHVGMLVHSDHVCKIYGYSEDDSGILNICMELIDGLEAYNFFHKNLNFVKDFPNVAKRIVLDVARGLADLHGSGILHRDIKSSNIMIEHNSTGEFKRAVIIDLGFATNYHDIPIGSKMGSIDYCCPEIIIGQSKLTFAVDMWALGIFIHEMLFRKFPFPEIPTRQLCVMIGNLKTSPQIPQYSGDNQDINDLHMICKNCLEIDPSKRITSAEVVARLS